MTRALLLSTFVSLTAFADAIGGTLTSTFKSFDQYGQPTVTLALNLTCSLSPCPMTKPQLHFSVAGGTNASFLSAPTERVGYVSAFFGSEPSGTNVIDSTQFPAGVAFKVLSKSVTCWCGNASGEGGYLDLTADTIIPPWINTAGSPPKVGDDWGLIISAKPMGGESVLVTLTGGGLTQTFSLGPADFSSGGTGLKLLRPTQAGELTISANLMPYDVGTTKSVTIVAGNSSGTGGGTSGTGGGSSGGTTEPTPSPGCAVAPGSAAILALVLVRLVKRSTK